MTVSSLPGRPATAPGQRIRALHTNKMASRVKAGSPHQQRKPESVASQRGGGIARLQKLPGQCDRERHHHPWQIGEPGMIGAARSQYFRWRIDYWRRSECNHGLRGGKRGTGEIGIADSIEHDLVRRQRRLKIVEFGHHHGGLEDAVVQQVRVGMLPPTEETSNSKDTGGPSPRYGSTRTGRS